MNGTVPSCLDDYGNPSFENGPCDQCEWKETCQKATAMRKKLENATGDQ